MPQAPKRLLNVPLGPSYHYGDDQLIKDYPYFCQSRSAHSVPTSPNLTRYFLECAIKHLVLECPLNPKNKEKVTLNLVQIILSPSGTESNGAKHVNTVTRA